MNSASGVKTPMGGGKAVGEIYVYYFCLLVFFCCICISFLLTYLYLCECILVQLYLYLVETSMVGGIALDGQILSKPSNDVLSIHVTNKLCMF